MIYIYQILRQIRIMRQYNANAIAHRINVPRHKFRDYESKFIYLPTEILTNWLTELDIPEVDHPWFIQRHKREYLYNRLSEFLSSPNDAGKELIIRIADILVFSDRVDISKINIELQKQVMPHLLHRPRSAEAAIDAIKDEDKGLR